MGQLVKRTCQSLQSIPKGLYLTLVTQALIPTLYTTVRIHLLGDLPQEWGVNIASQAAWLGVFFEVLQEGMVKPLYHILGSTATSQQETFRRSKTGLALVSGLFAFFCSLFAILAPQIVSFMASNTNTIEETITYIRWELVSSFVVSINLFLVVVVELLQMKKVLLISILVRLILTVTFDLLFVSASLSPLYMGVNGIAYSNIGTNLATFLVYMVSLYFNLKPTRTEILTGCDLSWFRQWLRLGLFSGFDSLVRNATYILLVLRSMNQLNQSGAYWVTNNFIWSWLLLPFLPLSEVLKVHVATAESKVNHWDRTLGYILITMGIALVWLVSIPSWPYLYQSVFNSEDFQLNNKLTLILLPFYILFLFNELMASILYGLGRTDLLAIQSLIGNVVLGTFSVLVICGLLPLEILTITLIFGGGLAFGCFLKGLIYAWLLRRMEYKI